jgi:hypothetical protein
MLGLGALVGLCDRYRLPPLFDVPQTAWSPARATVARIEGGGLDETALWGTAEAWR